MLTRSIAEARQLCYVLCVAHKALVNGVHGVFKGEGALKLSYLHVCRFAFLPLNEGVYQSGRAAQCRGVAVQLHLSLPVKLVKELSVQGHTHHAQVERVVLSIFQPFGIILLSRSGVLSHHISAEFDVVYHFYLRGVVLCLCCCAQACQCQHACQNFGC